MRVISVISEGRIFFCPVQKKTFKEYNISVSNEGVA